jgi:hypothetical protein
MVKIGVSSGWEYPWMSYSGADFLLDGRWTVVVIVIGSFITIFAVSILWATRPPATDRHSHH